MPSPPQPSAMQDTTTLKLCTDLWNHFTSLRSKNWHSACRLSPTPTSSSQASSSLLPICRAKAFVKARRGEEPMQALLNAYRGTFHLTKDQFWLEPEFFKSSYMTWPGCTEKAHCPAGTWVHLWRYSLEGFIPSGKKNNLMPLDQQKLEEYSS